MSMYANSLYDSDDRVIELLGQEPISNIVIPSDEWSEDVRERQDKILQQMTDDPDIRWIGSVHEKTPEWTRKRLEENHFPVETCGAVINDVYGHDAVCSLEIKPFLFNSMNQVMGGVTFSLGDYAAAVGDLMPGLGDTTADGHIQYLAPVQGKYLIAKVHCNHFGRRLAYYSIDFLTEEKRHVAKGSYTYYHVAEKR